MDFGILPRSTKAERKGLKRENRAQIWATYTESEVHRFPQKPAIIRGNTHCRMIKNRSGEEFVFDEWWVGWESNPRPMD